MSARSFKLWLRCGIEPDSMKLIFKGLGPQAFQATRTDPVICEAVWSVRPVLQAPKLFPRRILKDADTLESQKARGQPAWRVSGD